MKITTQYQNKTLAEIAHQYKKGFRAKQGLLILILLLYVIDSIRGIYKGLCNSSKNGKFESTQVQIY